MIYPKGASFWAFNHQPWSGNSWFCRPLGQLRWRFIIATAKARTQKCDCTTYRKFGGWCIIVFTTWQIIETSPVDPTIHCRFLHLTLQGWGFIECNGQGVFVNRLGVFGNDLNRRQTRRKDGIARWWFSITLENGYVNIYYMHTICIYILNIFSAMLLPPQHWNFHKDQWRAGHPAGPTSLPSWFVILGAMPQDLWFQRGFQQPWTHHLMRNSHIILENRKNGVPITIGFPYQEWPITWIRYAESGISLFWTPRSWPLFPVMPGGSAEVIASPRAWRSPSSWRRETRRGHRKMFHHESRVAQKSRWLKD